MYAFLCVQCTYKSITAIYRYIDNDNLINIITICLYVCLYIYMYTYNNNYYYYYYVTTTSLASQQQQ